MRKLTTIAAFAGIFLAHACGAKFTGNQGSFIVTGRGGTPVQPGEWLPDLELLP